MDGTTVEPLLTTFSVDPALLDALPDAFADALADVIAEKCREWERELGRVSAEARATIAEFAAANTKLATENAELRGKLKEHADSQVARIDAALALVKNGEPGRDADPEVVAEIAAKRVSAELTDVIQANVAAIYADVAALGVGLDGKIAEHVATAVADFPMPKNGENGEDGKDADPEVIAAIVAERVQTEVDHMREAMEAELLAINQSAQSQINTAIAALPVPKDGEPGKDADPEIVRTLVVEELQQAVKSLPVPQDGHTPTPEELVPLIERAVSAVAQGLPEPQTPEQIESLVDAAVAKLPPPEPGKSIDPQEVRQIIAELVADIPKPQDGKSVDLADLAEMVAGEVRKAVAALPVPKDGVGLAGAMIDRAGELAITLTDGTIRSLGPVVGKDSDRAEIVRLIGEEVAKFPPPRDGTDGLGFDDLTAEYDGERTVVLRFARGEIVKEFPMKLPIPIDRGIWRDGQKCETADVVGFGGSAWIAMRDTAEKPDLGAKDWRLLVKKGRDGKDGVVRGPQGPVKLG